MMGPHNFDAQKWIRKIKLEVVDPDDVADSSAYVFPEPISIF
jgi:hypothetical protein